MAFDLTAALENARKRGLTQTPTNNYTQPENVIPQNVTSSYPTAYKPQVNPITPTATSMQTPIQNKVSAPSAITMPAMSTTPNASTTSSQAYKSPYSDRMSSLLDKISAQPYQSPYANDIKTALGKITNAPAFSYNAETDPNFQSAKTLYGQQGDTAYNNNLASLTSRTGVVDSSWADAIASQARNAYNEKLMSLVPGMQQDAYNQYQGNINNQISGLNNLTNLDANSYNQYNGNISNQLAGVNQLSNLDTNAYNQFRDSVTNAQALQEVARKQYEAQGLVYNPSSGTYVNTAAQNQQGIQNKQWETANAEQQASIKSEQDLAATALKYKQYEDSITGLGNQADYSAMINSTTNPENAWKIPLLQQQKQLKLDSLMKQYNDNIGQYYNDYSQAIKDLSTSDPLYNQKLAALNVAKNNKLESIKQAKVVADQLGIKNNEFTQTLAETTRSNKVDESIKQQQANIAGSKLTNPAEKKSPYFEDVSKKLDNLYLDLSNSKKQDYLKQPGSVENKQFITSVMNALNNKLITSNEAELFFNIYNVPIPK